MANKYDLSISDKINLDTINIDSSFDKNRVIYEQISKMHQGIADFRAKLLALLPIASGVGIFLLLDKELSPDEYPFLLGVGIFGILVTVGLCIYELNGIYHCIALQDIARKHECWILSDRNKGNVLNAEIISELEPLLKKLLFNDNYKDKVKEETQQLIEKVLNEAIISEIEPLLKSLSVNDKEIEQIKKEVEEKAQLKGNELSEAIISEIEPLLKELLVNDKKIEQIIKKVKKKAQLKGNELSEAIISDEIEPLLKPLSVNDKKIEQIKKKVKKKTQQLMEKELSEKIISGIRSLLKNVEQIKEKVKEKDQFKGPFEATSGETSLYKGKYIGGRRLTSINIGIRRASMMVYSTVLAGWSYVAGVGLAYILSPGWDTRDYLGFDVATVNFAGLIVAFCGFLFSVKFFWAGHLSDS